MGANPSLRSFLLAGGPLDGKKAPLPVGDDPPHGEIMVEQEAQITATLAGHARIIYDGRQSIYLRYVLYAMAGRVDQHPIYRYVYHDCGFDRSLGIYVVQRSIVTD